jgi:putative flippase GtrA
MIKNLWLRLWKIRIFNFMFVGGLGFCVQTALYYPLTILIHNSIKFFNQIFYLPALIIVFPIVIAFNWWMNKKWTYKGVETKTLSFGRYEVMGLSTAVFDMLIIFLMVQFGHIFYLIATVLAACVMFAMRYFISNRWIWQTNKRIAVSGN